MAAIVEVNRYQAADVATTTPTVITVSAAPSTNGFILKRGSYGTDAPAGVAIASITQTNVTWTLVKKLSSGDNIAEEWKGAPTGTPGTSISVAVTGITTKIGYYVVMEVSGLPATTLGEVAAQCKTNFGIGLTPTTNTVTYPLGRNVLVSTIDHTTNTTVPSAPTNGWTAQATGNNNTEAALKIVANSSGTDSTSWTHSAGGTDWLNTITMYQGDLADLASKSMMSSSRAARLSAAKHSARSKSQVFPRGAIPFPAPAPAVTQSTDLWFFRNRRRYH